MIGHKWRFMGPSGRTAHHPNRCTQRIRAPVKNQLVSVAAGVEFSCSLCGIPWVSPMRLRAYQTVGSCRTINPIFLVFFIFCCEFTGAISQHQLFIPYRFGKSKGFESSKSGSALGDQRQSTANDSARFSAPNLGSAVVIRSGNTPRYPPRASHHVRDAGRFLFSVAVGKKQKHPADWQHDAFSNDDFFNSFIASGIQDGCARSTCQIGTIP